MTGRASVWSDPRVIELSREFVACTDEVWRLQRGTDPECVYFQSMANHGHYGGLDNRTRQGIYVCAANGDFLGSVNSRDADTVLAMMKAALKKWHQLPVAARQLSIDSEINPRHRWEDSYPEDGLVLDMFTRDLPSSGNATDSCACKWNQDRVWFSSAEAREWLPDELAVGSTCDLSTALLHRLVRRHLVDTVNGQTKEFRKNEISPDTKIDIVVEELDGSNVRISISGNTSAESHLPARNTSVHGVATSILGEAIYDREKSKFTKIEMVAIGERWGRTTFNGRSNSPASSAVGFVFQLSEPQAPRIPPAFVFSYDADWISRP